MRGLIGVDKFYHFIVCFIATLVVGVLSTMWGVCFALGLGIGKEVGDYFNKNSGWSWGDLIADLIGIATAVIMLIVVKKLI